MANPSQKGAEHREGNPNELSELELATMRLVPGRLRSGRSWWWTFALFIAAPALALALLGARAARLERIERRQQLRERQAQIARLADAALSTALARLEAELVRVEPAPGPTIGGALRDLPVFFLDRQDLVVFARDRTYFGEFGRQPAFLNWASDGARQQLAGQAQAAEAQQRRKDAVQTYRRISAAGSALRPWAELALARLRYDAGDAAALGLLANPKWSASDGATPTGLPVALLACSHAERVAAPQRARFAPLLKATLENLRAGRWWLSYDERRFYDEELRRLLALAATPASPVAVGADSRLEELAAIEHAIRRSIPYLRQGLLHRFEAGGGAGRGYFLVLWSPSEREGGTRAGVAVPQHQLAGLLDAALGPLFAGQPSRAALRDAVGSLIWTNGPAGASTPQAVSIRAVGGWELGFSEPLEPGSLLQRQVLWYAFVALLVVTLTVGLAMTARVVERELELGRMQSEFLAAVTHEFKSPITSIRLLLERVAGGRLRDPQSVAEYYGAIRQETDRLERLVNRLLESQKIQAGQKQYRLEPASLVAMAEAALERLRTQAEAKGIALELDVQGEIPELSLDEAAIADALENLLDNAIKYSPSGTRVRVEVQGTGESVRVHVCDQGIGIEQDDLPRIFDRFYRGRRGNQYDVHGTGLGLALVKAAAEAHGGAVEVSSVPGRGSRFTLRLPVGKLPAAGEPTPGAANHGASPDRG